MEERESLLTQDMAVSLDIELTRIDFSSDEHKFRELIKLEDIDKLKKFLKDVETICLTNVYDKTVQYAMASNNRSIVLLLCEMKAYQATTTTFKLAASMGYIQEFNIMLENRREMKNKQEIKAVLIAALESENIESIAKLQEMRRRNDVGKLTHDEIDGPINETLNSNREKYIDEDMFASQNSLKNAHNRISLYKIIANPLYIILYEVDPISASVDTSNELESLANRFPANTSEFKNISLNCRQLAVDLLDCCEDDDEVDCLLNLGIRNKDTNISRHGRLWQMMSEEFIEFVTHPNCQYWLYSKWCGTMLTSWENFSITQSALHILKHSLLFPVYSIRYAIVPPSLEEKAPINYYIHSLSAYCCFLSLLLYSVFYEKINEVESPFSLPDHAVAVWVVTNILHTINDIFAVPYPSYWQSWWTRYDLFMLFLFLIAGLSNFFGSINLTHYVPESHFLLVAEGVYAIAIVVSFIKILHWFHSSAKLGPVIISFSRMTNIILKLLIIFMIVLFAFSFGLYRLFRYFRISQNHLPSSNSTNVSEDQEKAVFTSYVSTLKVLFWVIFGYGEPDNIEIPSSYDWNIYEDESIIAMKQNFIMVVGYIMWALFHIAFVIVLLNMLIAIMTTTYESITTKSDASWKFARTRLWMYYMEENNIAPPPFNLVRYISVFLMYLYKKLTSQSNLKESDSNNEVAKQANKKYQDTLMILIDRYESKRFENAAHKDQWRSERISYVEARHRLLHNRINTSFTKL